MPRKPRFTIKNEPYEVVQNNRWKTMNEFSIFKREKKGRKRLAYIWGGGMSVFGKRLNIRRGRK